VVDFWFFRHGIGVCATVRTATDRYAKAGSL
jgi:hypothetical protein